MENFDLSDLRVVEDYHDTQIAYLGGSDIASLTIRSGMEVGILNFCSDGEYRAYIFHHNQPIPTHYTKVAEYRNWIHIYDDEELVFCARASRIEIFRAGVFGCIIRLHP